MNTPGTAVTDVDQTQKNKKKNKKKEEYIHKRESGNVFGSLTPKEREVLSTMPIADMYPAKTKEYKCLMRLQKKLQSETKDKTQTAIYNTTKEDTSEVVQGEAKIPQIS